MRAVLRAGLFAFGLALAPPATAQEFGIVQSPVLTIDQDRLYTGSAYGARVRAEIADASTALAAENREIEAMLIAEEQALTDQRSELSPEEFRDLADAFDTRVQQIRAEQDTKSRALSRRDDQEKQLFYRQIVGVLGELVRERGAVVIIERRSIFLAADSIDVTDLAIERIDASLGDGRPADVSDDEATSDTPVE